MSYSIARNTAFMTSASIAQKVISFFYFTLIARTVGAESTGKYFFALSFSTIFVVFVDLGFTNVLVREAAKSKERLQDFFSTILAAKIVFGILSYAAMVFTLRALGYEVDTRQLVYLSGLTMLFDSLHLTIYGALRALGDLRYEAISIPASQFLSMILGTTFLLLQMPLWTLILAFTIPSILNACFAATVLTRRYGIRVKPWFHRPTFSILSRIAVPFAIAAIFARVYSYIDSVLLSRLAGHVAVGLYSIPYKITFAFQFIPLALVAALYPRFSEYFVTSREKLAFTFERAFQYLLIIAVPIAIGISVLAESIIRTLYTSEYLPSVLPLQILVMSLIFSFVSFPIGALLNACNRQKTQTTIVGITLTINIFLNLLLIPRHGIVGAAIAAAIGNILLTTLGFAAVTRIIALSRQQMAAVLLRVLASGGVMGIIVWYAQANVHFVFAILLGGLVYIGLLFATRALSAQHLRELMTLMRR